MAATTLNKISQGTNTDLLTTQLNSVADNTMTAAGTAVNNVFATSNFAGYPYGDLQLILAAPGGTLTAGAAIYLWFLRSIDGGSTYEDGSASITPARPPDVIFPLRAVSTAQQVTICGVDLPIGYFEPIAKTVGMGQALGATGNKITVAPTSVQGQ